MISSSVHLTSRPARAGVIGTRPVRSQLKPVELALAESFIIAVAGQEQQRLFQEVSGSREKARGIDAVQDPVITREGEREHAP
jgi:hypothetical protein